MRTRTHTVFHVPATVFSLLIVLGLLVGVHGGTDEAHASGILIPNGEGLAPLRIVDHLVRVDLTDRVALTTVNQTFENTTDQRLEATYIFPIPEGADLTDFRMTFNGKMIQGEVLPADQARQIYEQIVRGNRDPGLIEFIGRRLLRARVFPIEPHSKTEIQISYQQIATPMSDMWRYHYPLRTPGNNSLAYGTVRFDVHLKSKESLKGIWSPTHDVEIVRESEHEAKIAFEKGHYRLDEDFVLLYGTDDSDVGLSLVTYQPDRERPGHFLLMLTPRHLWEDDVDVPQDYVFVVDTSGSMASGGKMEQAREALKYCVDRLEKTDRFSIVRFSTGFDMLFNELKYADGEAKKAAHDSIDKYDARGGTNIRDSLKAALKLRDNEHPDRPFVVIFLTDGQGDRSREEVEKMLAAETREFKEHLRIFPFGVGQNVNTKLLDTLATGYGGMPTYVLPGESLEHMLGDFFAVFSRPVLTDLELTLPDAVITDMYPPQPGDLYHGRQIILAGRFEKPVNGRVTLKAKRGDKSLEYTWNGIGFETTPEAHYVAPIWAGRKIAYLLDRIRLVGENDELKAEVVELSQKYGIQTPYSSWLVVPESERQFAAMRGVGGRRGRPNRPNEIQSGSGGFEGGIFGEELDMPVAEGLARSPADSFNYRANDLDSVSGVMASRIAVDQARARKSSSVADQRAGAAAMPIRRFNEREYLNYRGALIDLEFGEDTEIIEIKFASDAYFEFILNETDLREVLATASRTIVMVGDNLAVVIRHEGGLEELDEDTRKRLWPEG